MSAVAKTLGHASSMQFADLEREISARGVTLWIAALPPRALATGAATCRVGVEHGGRRGRMYPTALAATAP